MAVDQFGGVTLGLAVGTGLRRRSDSRVSGDGDSQASVEGGIRKGTGIERRSLCNWRWILGWRETSWRTQVKLIPVKLHELP